MTDSQPSAGPAELKHWHQEAKEILATKEDLHTQTVRFISIVGLILVLVLGAMYYMTNDLKSDLREIRGRLSATPSTLPAATPSASAHP